MMVEKKEIICITIVVYNYIFPVFLNQNLLFVRGHTFMTSSRWWGGGGQVKNGQNSDGSNHPLPSEF